MMSRFLIDHRAELIRRCSEKVALRPRRLATELQLSNGIPLFLTQLQRTLHAEETHHPGESVRISGLAGGAAASTSEMGTSAGLHGRQLLTLGFTVDQVVHDYGDLCQSITDLAFEQRQPFAVTEFRTLNRCLDNAIASAVVAFTAQRDLGVEARQLEAVSERVDVVFSELRSSLATVTYAIATLELGNLPMSGATGSVLKQSVGALRRRLGGPSLDDIRAATDS